VWAMTIALALAALLAVPAAATDDAGSLIIACQAATANRAAFRLVIPYEVVVPTPEYVAYLDDYVLPQFDGWAEAGVLASHAVYLARYPAGRAWQSLLVLEYRSDQALATRDAVVAKVRAHLAVNAKWKAMSENKKKVRAEKAPVLADPAAARQIP